MTPAATESLVEWIYKQALVLGEHVDSVLVLTSWIDDEGCTKTHYCGTGNALAKEGMARDYLMTMDANRMAAELGEIL